MSSDEIVDFTPQTKTVDDEFGHRLTRESNTDAVVAFVLSEQMGREAAQSFLHAVHNVERGGIGGRKNHSSSFSVELLSWRDDRPIGVRYVASDETTRKRFDRYLRDYAESESAVEGETAPFVDLSSDDHLAMATVTSRNQDYSEPIDDHPFARNRSNTPFETITNAMRGDSESTTDATVMVQFVCKPAISFADKNWLNWHSEVATRIGQKLKTYRAILTGSLAGFFQSGPGARPGYHVTARIIGVSSDPEIATGRVAQAAQCYQSASRPYRPGFGPVFPETRRIETLAMQAANREWVDDSIPLSVDTLAAVAHPPAARDRSCTERCAEREDRYR